MMNKLETVKIASAALIIAMMTMWKEKREVIGLNLGCKEETVMVFIPNF